MPPRKPAGTEQNNQSSVEQVTDASQLGLSNVNDETNQKIKEDIIQKLKDSFSIEGDAIAE